MRGYLRSMSRPGAEVRPCTEDRKEARLSLSRSPTPTSLSVSPPVNIKENINESMKVN